MSFKAKLKNLLSSKIFISSEMLENKITVFDIGAIGGLQWPWSKIDNFFLDCTFFEPQLNKEIDRHLYGKNAKIINEPLWNENTKKTLYINKGEQTSSLYKPNINFLKYFPDYDRFKKKQEIELYCTTINSLFERNLVKDVDFIKIDIQGSELNVLKGGGEYLSENLVALEIEVEFSEIYDGQPLFSEVDAYIRKKLNLSLWDLDHRYFKYKEGKNKNINIKGQLIYADALYFRPLKDLKNWLSKFTAQKSKNKLLSLLVCVIAYGYYDYALALLNQPFIKDIVGQDKIDIYKNYINQNSKSIRPFNNGNSYLYFIFDVLAYIFKTQNKGWASGGHTLGTRKYGFFRRH